MKGLLRLLWLDMVWNSLVCSIRIVVWYEYCMLNICMDGGNSEI